MGLFVAEDGHYQGWLAAFMCCCAAVNEDEHPIEKHKSQYSTQFEICNKQPLPLSALPPAPASRQVLAFKGDEPIIEYPARPSPARLPNRPPSLQPLELGDSFLYGQSSRHDRPKSSYGCGNRPSISTPTSFRRLDYTDGQRASLIPLRLGPVVLKDMPTPDDTASAPVTEFTPGAGHGRSDSAQGLLHYAMKQPSQAQRDTPFERCQQRSSAAQLSSVISQFRSSAYDSSPASEVAEQRTSRPLSSTHSSSGSFRRQPCESTAPRTVRRPSNDRNRLRRKRSLSTVRRPYAESGDLDVDKEILELNTIVEERRADAIRRQSTEQHIAAIAPTMQVRARSETLRDIGSGLARPLTGRDTTCAHDDSGQPTKPSRPSTARTASRSSSRVSGWLSGLVQSASSTRTQMPSQEPFYKCVPPARPRPQSEASLCSSITAMESPSLTVASSPTSRAHSRSLTAESRITPISLPSTIYYQSYAETKREAEQHWSVAAVSPSQVGIAL